MFTDHQFRLCRFVMLCVQMRRRAFEEKVQREKQRRLDRERERAERDRELTRVKRAHEKEVNRLRQQLGDRCVTLRYIFLICI